MTDQISRRDTVTESVIEPRIRVEQPRAVTRAEYERGPRHGDEEVEGAVGGAVVGALVGAVVAGPVGAVIGGAIGAASGATVGALDQRGTDETTVVTSEVRRS